MSNFPFFLFWLLILDEHNFDKLELFRKFLLFLSVYHRNEFYFLWILLMCKLRQITHKLSKEGLYMCVMSDLPGFML